MSFFSIKKPKFCDIILDLGFTNILRAAFMSADPESAKKTDNLTVFGIYVHKSYT